MKSRGDDCFLTRGGVLTQYLIAPLTHAGIILIHVIKLNALSVITCLIRIMASVGFLSAFLQAEERGWEGLAAAVEASLLPVAPVVGLSGLGSGAGPSGAGAGPSESGGARPSNAGPSNAGRTGPSAVGRGGNVRTFLGSKNEDSGPWNAGSLEPSNAGDAGPSGAGGVGPLGSGGAGPSGAGRAGDVRAGPSSWLWELGAMGARHPGRASFERMHTMERHMQAEVRREGWNGKGVGKF